MESLENNKLIYYVLIEYFFFDYKLLSAFLNNEKSKLT